METPLSPDEGRIIFWAFRQTCFIILVAVLVVQTFYWMLERQSRKKEQAKKQRLASMRRFKAIRLRPAVAKSAVDPAAVSESGRPPASGGSGIHFPVSLPCPPAK